MKRVLTLCLVPIALLWFGGSVAAPALAHAGDLQTATAASAKAKKKCRHLKGKKKRKCLKRAAGKGKGGKPWAGSAYRPGITCAFTSAMQKRYAKYGLTCIVISADPYLTTLIPLKGPVQ